MNSEKDSLIAMHPFIQKFVFSIIQTIRARNFEYETREVVHADLVPKVSKNVMMTSLGKRFIEAPEIKTRDSVSSKLRANVPSLSDKIEPKKIEDKKKDMSALVAPIDVVGRRKIERRQNVVVPQKMITPKRTVMPPVQTVPIASNQKIGIQTPQGKVILSQDYGKITPLLNDPSVSTIECQGAGKPITVIRAGQRQITRIVLNEEEIRGVLEKVADAAHIPLIEGVFRATVDGLGVNAVISEILGTKFLIKKATAYGLLE